MAFKIRLAAVATATVGVAVFALAPAASAGTRWYTENGPVNKNGNKYICYSPERDAAGFAAYRDDITRRDADLVRCPKGTIPINLTI